MSEDQDQDRVEDKFGKDIKKGDRVYFVHGGEHHSMIVDEIDTAEPPDSPYPHILRGTITVTVHAASVTRGYRGSKEERQEREEDPQTAHIDKQQQETETPEGDKPKTHRTSTRPTTKKGSNS